MAKSKKFLVSIVVPVMNEAENIQRFYEAVRKQLARCHDAYDYEMIFTDNASTDGTFSHLSTLAQEDPGVKVVRFCRNFGYQRSILTGYCFAGGDCAIQIDCDLQDPPEMIPDFLAKWEEGYDVVYGVRRARKEHALLEFVRRFFYRAIDLLSEERLPHDAGDFRLVDAKVLSELKKLYDTNPYLRGTIATMGFRQIGIPYDRAARARGKSKFNLFGMVSLAVDGVLNHSIVPLRLATLTGFMISTGLILYLGILLLGKWLFHYEWPRGFATVAILILISISLNALFLGVIGEYLGRIYRQVKRQPITIIDKTLNVAGPPEPVREGNY